jgi:predicted nucleotidyltransferase
MNAQVYIPLIVERLKKISPYKIILFGSYAYGEPDVDSDIDLLVVTNSDDFPQNYRENSDLYLEVSRVIRDIRAQAPIELIVQTKPMHSKFIELGSMFSKEILQKGLVLYEADNPGLAR